MTLPIVIATCIIVMAAIFGLLVWLSDEDVT